MRLAHLENKKSRIRVSKLGRVYFLELKGRATSSFNGSRIDQVSSRLASEGNIFEGPYVSQICLSLVTSIERPIQHARQR